MVSCAVPSYAQPEAGGDDQFRIEVTSGYWLPGATGSVRSGPNAVDLESDLGIEQNRVLFAGRLTLKPGRRHRILVEGLPYRLRGSSDLSRDFSYSGRSFFVQDTISSSADLTYFVGGYQYDVVSNPGGHLGLQFTAGVMRAEGTVQSLRTGLTATESQVLPIPVVGVEAQRYLMPNKRIDLNGEFKGMSYGSLGRYTQGAFKVGVRLFSQVAAEAGYMFVDADLHTQSGTKGVNVNFRGPVFSLRYRDR
jgi:hypothetical protein